MISTSVIHINTAMLPVYFGGAAIILHSAGRIRQRETLKGISYRLFMLTGLVTTLTCAFGGASIRHVEAIPSINSLNVKLHAWTSMLAFLLALALAYYSFKAVRNRGNMKKTDKILFILSLIFLVFFICTTIIAISIR